MFLPARTHAARNAAACSLRKPSPTRSSRVPAASRKRRIVQIVCPFDETGGIAAVSREPSGRRASTRGVMRSSRFPSTCSSRRSTKARTWRSSSKTRSGTRSILSPVSRKRRLGPLIIHSCATGSASIRSAIAPSPINSLRSSAAIPARSRESSAGACPLSASASYERRVSSISSSVRPRPFSLARFTSSWSSARSRRPRMASAASSVATCVTSERPPRFARRRAGGVA